LRRKLIWSFLTVNFLGGILSLVIGTRIEHQTIISLAEAKVRHDLASAWMVYEERLHGLRDTVRLSATQEFLRAALRQADLGKVVARLDGIRREFGLDVLNLTDALGRVVVRSRRVDAPVGDDVALNPFVALGLRKEVSAGTRIVPREELLKDGADLADRAHFQFVPTPMAAARPEGHEDKGMMLASTRRSATTSPLILSSPSAFGKRFPPAPGSSPGRSSSRTGPTSPTGRIFNSSRRPWRPRDPKAMRTRA
jgi:hypothetical protein